MDAINDVYLTMDGAINVLNGLKNPFQGHLHFGCSSSGKTYVVEMMKGRRLPYMYTAPAVGVNSLNVSTEIYQDGDEIVRNMWPPIERFWENPEFDKVRMQLHMIVEIICIITNYPINVFFVMDKEIAKLLFTRWTRIHEFVQGGHYSFHMPSRSEMRRNMCGKTLTANPQIHTTLEGKELYQMLMDEYKQGRLIRSRQPDVVDFKRNWAHQDNKNVVYQEFGVPKLRTAELYVYMSARAFNTLAASRVRPIVNWTL